MLKYPQSTHSIRNNAHNPNIIIDNKISGVCVVDDEQNLVGILSELDCLRAALNAIYTNTGVGLVRDHMAASNLVVAHPDEDIVDVAQDMLQKNKRRRPVVEDGKLVGIVTSGDILAQKLEKHEETIEYLNEYMFGPYHKMSD